VAIAGRIVFEMDSGVESGTNEELDSIPSGFAAGCEAGLCPAVEFLN
jgi:hypothetical protein